MRRVIPALLLVCAAFAPTAALAQTRPPAPSSQPARRPPPRKPPVGVRAYGFYEFQALAAADTFNAVTGSSTTNGFGAGFEVTNVVRKIFIRATFAHAGKDGERVFVNNGQVFKLGIPLTVGMTPIELGGGWRTIVDRRGRYAIYVGAGVVFLNYSETTPSGTSDDNTSKTFSGFSVYGGFDRTFHKHLIAGVEGQYPRHPERDRHGRRVAGLQRDESRRVRASRAVRVQTVTRTRAGNHVAHVGHVGGCGAVDLDGRLRRPHRVTWKIENKNALRVSGRSCFRSSPSPEPGAAGHSDRRRAPTAYCRRGQPTWPT